MNTYVSVSTSALVTNNQHPPKPIFLYRICRYSDIGNRTLSCIRCFVYSLNIPLLEIAWVCIIYSGTSQENREIKWIFLASNRAKQTQSLYTSGVYRPLNSAQSFPICYFIVIFVLVTSYYRTGNIKSPFISFPFNSLHHRFLFFYKSHIGYIILCDKIITQDAFLYVYSNLHTFKHGLHSSILNTHPFNNFLVFYFL